MIELWTNEVLRVTPEGKFIWAENADEMIEKGDFSAAPAMPYILRALRLNAELIEALRVAVDSDLGAKWVWHESGKEAWITHARAALAKVKA